MDSNLPAHARDTGSIPDPGRFYMPWSNQARESQLLRLHALELVLQIKRNHCSEKLMRLNKE